MLLEITLQKERMQGKKEGRREGELKQLIKQSCRKLSKGKSTLQIAEELETDPALIAQIVEAAQQTAPDYDTDRIYEILQKAENFDPQT